MTRDTAPDTVSANGRGLHAASAADFHRQAERGDLYLLPGSGLIARLRHPPLTAMAAKVGMIPNPLAEEVLRFLSIDTLAEDDAAKIARFQRNSRVFIEIASLAFVEPRLVLDRPPDYEQGEIGPLDLADADYTWVYFELVGGKAADLAPFRVAERPEDP